MEFIQNILANTQYAFIAAFILGLMTAISPCPLATNISAIGFISRDISHKNRVFISGLFYTLGRIVSYTSIAVILYFTANQINISIFLQKWGEKILGPLLIVIGLFMLNIIKINIFTSGNFTNKIEEKLKKSYWSSFLLGLLFALAFCPYSGVLYFGVLIPMSVVSVSGLFLPVIFAIATALPVVLFAWLLAYSIKSMGVFYNRITTFEYWFRRIVAILFIGVGVYYIILNVI